MSAPYSRLFALLKQPKDQRRQLRYTEADITKEALEKWAAENGKSRTQIHRRKYHIKKHMRIRDAKEAAAAEEAKDRADSGTGDGNGLPGTGEAASTGEPRPGASGTERRQRHPKGFLITNDKPRKQAKPAKKEKKPKEQRVKHAKSSKDTVSKQLDFDTGTKCPLDHATYVSMMIDEYGGGAGVMQLMDDGVLPSGLVL